jgi:hypothetical protein
MSTTGPAHCQKGGPRFMVDMVDKETVQDENTQQTAEKKQVLEFIEPPEGIAFVYANHVQVGQSAFDVRIRFGEAIRVANNQVTIEQRAHVTMTWLQVKQLCARLNRIIEAYEKENGPIKPPKLP